MLLFVISMGIMVLGAGLGCGAERFLDKNEDNGSVQVEAVGIISLIIGIILFLLGWILLIMISCLLMIQMIGELFL